MKDIVKMANDLKQGKVDHSSINNIIKNGFNDYNNDFSQEIKYILSEIFRNPEITLESKDVYPLMEVIFRESDEKIFFNNYQHKNLTYSQKEISLAFDYRNGDAGENISEFFSHAFKQEDLKLTDLFILKILVRDMGIGTVLLESESISLARPILEFVKNRPYYADIIKDKQYKVHENNSIEKLSQELLKTCNYLNEFFTTQPQVAYDQIYLNSSLNKIYDSILNENNDKKNEFSFETVEKIVKVAIESKQFERNFPRNVAEFREKYKDKPSPFSKLKN